MELSIEETNSRKERKLNHVEACLYQRVFFNERCGSDFMIISAEGCAFPCHTTILSTECEVFSSMFQTNWIEVTSTRLALQDMSAQSVEAFLRYLYLRDVQKPQNKFSVAVELYLTSHKFMLHDLTAELTKIILDRQYIEWYSDVEACFQLYNLASIIKEERIVTRMLKVLKRTNHNVQNVLKIREYCRVDPSFALKLFWDSFSVCTCTTGFSNLFEQESSESEYLETDEDSS